MKNRIVFALILTSILSLTGCGNEKPEPVEMTIPALTEAPETQAVIRVETTEEETEIPAETTAVTEAVTVPETAAATEETVAAETEPKKVMGKVIKVESLNVREGPSVNTKIVKKLHLNDEVTIREGIVLDSVEWAHIDGGWVCLDYLKVSGPVPAPQGKEPGGMPGVVYHTDTVNVRAEPNGGAEKVGKLCRNDIVVIYEIQKGWGRMDLGWVSMDYVQLQKDNEKLSVTGGDWVPEHTPESDLHDFTAPSEGEYMENPVEGYWK